MRRAFVLFVVLLALSAAGWAQETIPAGTVLPAELTASLDSAKSRPGQVISGWLVSRFAEAVIAQERGFDFRRFI